MSMRVDSPLGGESFATQGLTNIKVYFDNREVLVRAVGERPREAEDLLDFELGLERAVAAFKLENHGAGEEFGGVARMERVTCKPQVKGQLAEGKDPKSQGDKHGYPCPRAISPRRSCNRSVSLEKANLASDPASPAVDAKAMAAVRSMSRTFSWARRACKAGTRRRIAKSTGSAASRPRPAHRVRMANKLQHRRRADRRFPTQARGSAKLPQCSPARIC